MGSEMCIRDSSQLGESEVGLGLEALGTVLRPDPQQHRRATRESDGEGEGEEGEREGRALRRLLTAAAVVSGPIGGASEVWEGKEMKAKGGWGWDGGCKVEREGEENYLQ